MYALDGVRGRRGCFIMAIPLGDDLLPRRGNVKRLALAALPVQDGVVHVWHVLVLRSDPLVHLRVRNHPGLCPARPLQVLFD